MDVVLSKRWELQIPDEVSDYCMLGNDLYITTSSFSTQDGYVHSIGRFEKGTGTCSWRHKFRSSTASSSRCTIIDGRLIFMIGPFLIQADPNTGDKIFEFDCGDTIWGPFIQYNGKIIFSSSPGKLFVWDLKHCTCEHTAQLLSNFYRAVICDEKLYAMTQGELKKKYFFQRNQRAAHIEAFKLDDFSRQLFLDLGESCAFTSIGVHGKDLLLARSNMISLITSQGKTKWSRAIGPERPYASTNFHGNSNTSILVSADRWLGLVDSTTGEGQWLFELDILADALLMDDGSVIFSTCGGGLDQLPYGIDPQNYIGRLDPHKPNATIEHSIPYTSRIQLRRIDNTLVASSVIRGFENEKVTYKSHFIEFVI
jgi:outer membrane protein assembly factor BamB